MVTPHFDSINNSWKLRVKNIQTGKWSAKTLCKGEYAATPPAHVMELAAAVVTKDDDSEGDGGLRSWCNLYHRRHPSKRPNGVRRRAGVLKRFCEFADSQGWDTLESI